MKWFFGIIEGLKNLICSKMKNKIEKQMNSIKNKILKSELVCWKELKFIQQDKFKELTKDAYSKLRQSIINNDFVESFKVWQCDKNKFCLDGFHRIKVFKELVKEGYTVPEKFRADFIDCKDKREASKLILIYSSIYAKINEQSLDEYLNMNELDIDELKLEIDLPEIDFGYFEDANFDPASIDEQGKLDEKKKIKCPNCSYEFEN